MGHTTNVPVLVSCQGVRLDKATHEMQVDDIGLVSFERGSTLLQWRRARRLPQVWILGMPFYRKLKAGVWPCG